MDYEHPKGTDQGAAGRSSGVTPVDPMAERLAARAGAAFGLALKPLLDMLADAVRANRRASVFFLVVALVATAGITQLVFGFDPWAAVVFLAIALAAGYAVPGLLDPPRNSAVARSRQLLREFMAWGLALLLLVCGGALAAQTIIERYRDPMPVRPSVATFSRFDEQLVNMSNPSAPIVTRLKLIADDTLRVLPGSPPIIAMIAVVRNIGTKPDGSSDVVFELLTRNTTGRQEMLVRHRLDGQGALGRGSKLASRHPLGVPGFLGELRAQGVETDGAMVFPMVLSCVPNDVVRAGRAVFQIRILDDVRRTWAESDPLEINLRLVAGQLAACPQRPAEQATGFSEGIVSDTEIQVAGSLVGSMRPVEGMERAEHLDRAQVALAGEVEESGNSLFAYCVHLSPAGVPA